ncbi:MAG TPA: chitobiase/beta-hexosaminidase C-terminal domain-containing protein [Candidatus Saccharimonadales bacterium]|nr:chitobiase/beta-hexosaminidase C-terminal domain-containing protein [Candidatus Saccharimonadales bacterium]
MRKAAVALGSLAGLYATVCLCTQQALAAVPIASMPLVSAGLPAYTSDDCFTSKPASDANSGNYSVPWRSCNNPPSTGTPVTLTYDISSVPSAQRTNDVLVWFNDFSTGNYNPTLNSNNYYNTPKDYTVQGNTAASSGTPPASGWVTLATVTNNPYHSLQHVLNLSTYNWVRLSFTSSNGVSPNGDIALSMDIHDAANGIVDDWIFYGDSITQSGLLNDDTNGQTFAQQIHTATSTYYPVAESGGIGGFTSSDALTNIGTWLPLFPGKFVALNYGTNDANSNLSPATFYSDMATMVQDIIAAGKVPIVPTIPWGCTANLTANVPTFNTEIQALYAAYPQIIKGPDLYTYFLNNQAYISGADCIHPNATGGWTAYRAQWAQAMASTVYTVPTASITPAGGNVTSTQSVTLTSSKAGTVHYTTDGSTPTPSSPVYASALMVSSTETVKALAIDQAGNQSDVSSATYTFPTPTPSSSPSPTPPIPPSTKSTSTTVATTTSTVAAVQPTSPSAPAETEAASPTTTSSQSRTVIITLTNQQRQPLANTEVSLSNTGQTATTNTQGVAIFYNVTPGAYTVHSNAHYMDAIIQVTSGASAQEISVRLAASTARPSVTLASSVSGAAICLMILLVIVGRRKLQARA